MNRTQIFLKRHSSTILTFAGATGVVATAILSAKATPKALRLIDEAQKEKGCKLTTIEAVKVAWKPYTPALLTGFSTMACIFGANYLSMKSQASLMSAYALLNNSFNEYQNKVQELDEGKTDINVKQEVIKSKWDNDTMVHDDRTLFYDYQSQQFFESDMKDVMQAECEFKEILDERGYACINEYYDLLGIPRTEYGYQLGWFSVEDNDPYNCHGLEFDYEKIMLDNNLECFVITPNMPASYDFIISSSMYKI